MPRTLTVSGVVRSVLLLLPVVVVSYLAVLAWDPSVRERLPAALRWFGQPGSWQTITIVVVLLVAICVVSVRSARAHRAGNATLAIFVGLTAANFVLGMSSYWRCYDATRPPFFTPLMWTVGLLKGGVDDKQINGRLCPAQIPVALEVA